MAGLARRALARRGPPRCELGDGESAFPTFLAVVADDARKHAAEDRMGRQAREQLEGVVRVSTLAELKKRGCNLKSREPWQAGRVYRRHEDPENPSYFLVEKWAVKMTQSCLDAMEKYLVNLGLEEFYVSWKMKASGRKSVKARLFGDRGGVAMARYSKFFCRPSHPPFIKEGLDMFWVRDSEQCVIAAEERTVFELGQAFVEAGQPTVESVDLKITFARKHKAMRHFAAKFKALFSGGEVGVDWKRVGDAEATTELFLSFYPLELFMIPDDLPLTEKIDARTKPSEIKINCSKFLGLQASQSWLLTSCSFNIACVGPVNAGKSCLIHSANVALNQLVGFNNNINTGDALMEQGLRVRGVASEEQPRHHTKESTNLFKMLDCSFKTRCKTYQGELRLMDTTGIPASEADAARWKERILQDEPGVRSSLKAQVMEVAIPDVTLLVFDAKDLFQRISQALSARAFMAQYRPLIDEIRAVLPNHPYLVVLTKMDELNNFMDSQDGTLEDAKAQLEEEVKAVFSDTADVVCVTNHTIPTMADRKAFAALESGATSPGQARTKYLAQIAEWTKRNNEHLLLMFLATNAARDVKEKLRATAQKTCTVM
ncbi:unnamed protein product [Durusdinium trenchii]|uniref:G domain-containing protein n=1 Tax=Durusdinium trenchii TaxID=1381693 RepID=A0ABP0MJ24_9DINO